MFARVIVVLGGLGCGLGVAQAQDSSCRFQERDHTLLLEADCETRSTLFVPDGFTLDGQGHTIHARQSDDATFVGAVVQNRGRVAHVRNVVIDARALPGPCQPADGADTRLRGILFRGASGSIEHNRVSVDRGLVGCLEGVGIELRPAPDTTHGTQHVSVVNNQIDHFEKVGIYAQGPVTIELRDNRIHGAGPLRALAQNGVLLREQVGGVVEGNLVTDVLYAGSGFAATGILLLDSDQPLSVVGNRVEQTDVALRLAGVQRACLSANVLSGATFDGIALDGRHALVTDNEVRDNEIREAGIAVDLFGPGTTANLVSGNRAFESGVQAMQQAEGALDNLLEHNSERPTH